MISSNDNKSTNKIFIFTIIGLIVFWLISGIYSVDQGNRAVITQFGAYVSTNKPGLYWHWPFPIEDATIVNIENQHFIEIGYRSKSSPNTKHETISSEALMLTKDNNIVSISLAVHYQVKNAKDYVFNVWSNEYTLKQVTESILREVVGRNTMIFILVEGQRQVVFELKDAIQKAIDNYGTGLLITNVSLHDARPPKVVEPVFLDAIRSRENKQRLINEAQAYADDLIPKAKSTSARLLQEAEAYEVIVLERAKGEAERFEQILVEYEKAPSITRKRLYLEAKENALKDE